MCLAIPVRVVELCADDMAIVDLSGVRKEISLAMVDDVAVGDYVILHVGFALSKLDPEEAAKDRKSTRLNSSHSTSSRMPSSA
jgi:hydrogenase expression/formation protein HypC